MRRGINGMALIPTDLFTSIEAVSGAGYDVIELWAPRIARFLDEGHEAQEIADKLKVRSLDPHSIVAIDDVDIPNGTRRRELLSYCRRMCEVANAIGCPNVQIVSGSAFAGSPWPIIRRETARGMREMADLAGEYGLTLAYEPLAWTPVKTLEQGLEVVDAADRPNIGLLIDTFMVFAGGGEMRTIRSLNPKKIPTVHLGDTAPKAGEVWSDDDRYPMPGDGIVPLQQIMRVILDTGYDGVVTDEISPKRYENWDRCRLAKEVNAKGDAVLISLQAGED